MGRYTSVQTYADNNQRQVPVPYEKATGGARAEPGAPGGGARRNATTVRTTEVRETSGSTAGAGSLNFHVYRLERRREMERLQQMDTDHDKLVADQDFHAQLERNQRDAEARTAARAEKRKRRKERSRSQRKRPQGAARREEEEDGDEAEEEEEGAGDDSDGGEPRAGAGGEEAAAAVAGGSGAPLGRAALAPLLSDGVVDDLLSNDGRFLERYEALVRQGAARVATDATDAAAQARRPDGGTGALEEAAPASDAAAPSAAGPRDGDTASVAPPAATS